MKITVFEMFLSALALFISRAIGSFVVRPALGAKSGIITAPSGSDATIKALGDSAPATNTLAGVVRDAFSATALAKVGLINFVTRHATIAPAATNIVPLTEATGITCVATLTPDDVTKPNGSWTRDDTGSGHASALDDIISPVKPSISVESLVNKIEDLVTDPDGVFAGDNTSVFVVIDQTNNNVRVYQGTTDVVSGISGTSLAEDAEFHRRVSTRYDKLASSFFAFVTFSSILHWLE